MVPPLSSVVRRPSLAPSAVYHRSLAWSGVTISNDMSVMRVSGSGIVLGWSVTATVFQHDRRAPPRRTVSFARIESTSVRMLDAEMKG